MANSASDYVWPHLAELPAFRALIRSIEHRVLAEHKPFDGPVLDLGIGDGHFGSVALGPGLDIGVDVTLSTMIEAKRREVYRHLVCASATHLPFATNFFSTVVSNCVIEHIPDLQSTLAEMYRVLRPGGKLLVTVPTNQLQNNLLIPRLLRSVGLRGVGEYYANWFRRMQVHYHMLSREQWLAAMVSAGLQPVESRGYLSREATYFLELGHYEGWHNVLSRRLLGRWVVWPWRPRFFLVERLLSRFTDEPEHADDSGLFVLAQKLTD